jgi:HTH-type transcriptional regulator/antitoxin HigA
MTRLGTIPMRQRLIRRFPLRPIRSEIELDRAIAVVDALLDQASLTGDERDYFEVLTDLIERHETETDPVPVVDAAGMLRHLLAARGVALAEVARETGVALATVQAVLSGKRSLGRVQAANVAAFFHVAPAAFVAKAQRPRAPSARGGPG